MRHTSEGYLMKEYQKLCKVLKEVKADNEAKDKKIAELEDKNKKLIGLTLRMVDRGCVFVHGSLASNAARSLFDEAQKVIQENSKGTYHD